MNKSLTPDLNHSLIDNAEFLHQFRATHRNLRQTINGHHWEYISCGAGPEAILVLPGGLAISETAFRYIQRFESRYCVIAPTYPSTITTMSQLVDGLQSLLHALHIGQAHVIGGSYSGLVAQCLVRSAPSCVTSLVLSDTGVPRYGRALQLLAALELLHMLPMGVVHRLLRLGIEPFLRGMANDQLFWRRYFTQLIGSLTKQACSSFLHVWIDFDRNFHFAPNDLRSWSGRILLIAAQHDRLFKPAEQQVLKHLYPAAQLHIFAHSPHSASLARIEEYITVIEHFFAREAYA